MRSIHRTAIVASSIALGAALAANAAHAQAAPAPAAAPASNGIADIVVTAQKRSENLQKVPIAISAVSAAKITSARITTTIDLEQVVPGLVTNNFANAGIFFLPYIRGVGSSATGVGNSSSVATYVDGVYQPASTANVADLPDLDHIEVVKGPQGTLFGRNATGGAINVLTKAPSHDFQLTADGSFGRFDESVDKLYITGPLSDTLAASVAYEFHGGGDYIHYIPTDSKIGGFNNHTVNAKLRWNPSDRFEATAGFIYSSRHLSDSSQGLAFAPEGGTPVPAQLGIPVNYRIGYSDTSAPNDFRVKVEQYQLHAKYSADGFDIVSISGYIRNTNHILDDFDSSVGNLFYFQETDQIRAFSQELQLVSNGSGPFKWLAGLYYSSDKESYDPLTFGIGVPIPPTPANVAGAPGGMREDTFATSMARSYAAFGQASYELAPHTNLTLGIRYTAEQRKLTGEQIIQTPVANGSGGYTFDPTVIATAPAGSHKWFNKPTWRASLDHDFGSVLVYASYNRGFKSGVYNTTDLTQPPVKPEVLDAYEVGAKAKMLDGHLVLNAAGFYYDYKNIQVQVTTGGPITLQNAARGRLYGLDLDAVLQPVSDLTLRASLNLLHSEYRDYKGAVTYTLVGGAGVSTIIPDASGTQMIYAPKYSFDLGADYKLHLGESSLVFSGNYYYSAKFNTIIGQGNFIKAYGTLNGTITWNAPGDKFYVGVYGRNLTNNRDVGRYLNSFGLERQTVRPATYGVTFGIKLK